MTKERLKEIRKLKYAEDRIVYTVFDGDEKATALNIVNDDEFFIANLQIERLYETREQAEWHCKIDAARTEQFEPPMWEEIKDTYEFHFTCQNYTHKRTDGIIETVYTPQCFMFYVHKSEQPNYNRVMIRNYRIYAVNIEVFDEPATKENYEKACEMVRDLFKGEK